MMKINHLLILLMLIGVSCVTGKLFTVQGTVTSITAGKDGYMADVTAEDGTKYSATVSIIKMQRNYVQLKEGDKITISGDTIRLEDKINILAKEIKKQ